MYLSVSFMSFTSGYWHQVRSFGHMNTAVAIWFSTIDSFDRTGCDGQLFDFAPMNTIPIIWRYSGKQFVFTSHFMLSFVTNEAFAFKLGDKIPSHLQQESAFSLSAEQNSHVYVVEITYLRSKCAKEI